MGLLDNDTDFVKNPAELTIEWAGDGVEGGYLKAYNPDTKTTDNLGNHKPLVPIVSTSAISGYKKLGPDSGISYFSNEVVRTNSDNLTVFEKKTGDKAKVMISGLYSDIKDHVNGKGAGYIKNIYCFDGEKIVRLKLKGGSLFSFGEAEEQIPNGKANTGKAIAVTGYEQKKNGGVHYRTPKFSVVDVDKEVVDKAFELASQKVAPFIDDLRKRALEEPPPPAAPSENAPVASATQGIEEDVPF